MNRRWDDTFLPDDGLCPPCRLCDEPVTHDDDGYPYDLCVTCLDALAYPKGDVA